MKVVDRFNVSKEPEGPRKFTFEFTGPGLISVIVVGVLGIAWIFILGILVGRGHKPENAIPQVAQIMPSSPTSAQPDNREQPTVLKAEELQFQDTLQGKKPHETVTVDSTRKSEQALAGGAAAKPGGQSGAASAPGAAPGSSKAGAQPGAASQPGPAQQPGSAQQAAAKPGQQPTPEGPALTAGPLQTTTLEKTPAPLPKGRVATAPAQPDKKAAPVAVEPLKPAPVAKADAKDAKGKDIKLESRDAKAKDAKADSKDAKAKDQKDAAAAKDARDSKDSKDKKDPKEQQYRKVYQFSAQMTRAAAQEEVDRLAKKGVKAEVVEVPREGKATIYRVLAPFKGTDTEIRQALDKIGVKKPILRDKKSL